MASSLKEVYVKCAGDPQWESEHITQRPLRGPQAEIISRVEKHVRAHEGGVMTIRSARQTGKNETAAVIHKRHLWYNQFAASMRSWIRTAPTYIPQIVNSKKRLRELLKADAKWKIRDPLFLNQTLTREEGYIWRLGNASLEFVSSGPNANVVGATASECLDMDEAHKVSQAKFDEDFAPFTANTNAATLLWGVAGDGLDTIQAYVDKNAESGRKDLNLFFPCEVWMDVHPPYRAHVEERVKHLGYDHPIIKTQYRLIPVSAEGSFLNDSQVRRLMDSQHERHITPQYGSYYEALIDLAGANEDFNPGHIMEGKEDTATDSTVIWIYEVSSIVSSNGVFPFIRIVNLIWITGAALEQQQIEIEEIIEYWRIGKVTVDAVGIGLQIAGSLERKYGPSTVNKYIANSTSVSEDCFDLIARLNFSSINMFRDDSSPEYAEFARQCKWTKYFSSEGKMKLIKPDAKKHIDMVKALTYINRNKPVAGADEMYSAESRSENE